MLDIPSRFKPKADTYQKTKCKIASAVSAVTQQDCEHQTAGMPTNLVFPVLTKPELVQQAAAGILSGQISISLSNVEPLPVLANAVGVSHTAKMLASTASWLYMSILYLNFLLGSQALADMLAAVQFVSLESACMGSLTGQAQHLDASELLCLAQLTDHLGLSPLLDTAAEHLTVVP